MDIQNKRIIIRIDEDTKNKFNVVCNDKHMTLSSRIKYLIKMDIEGKLKIYE